MYIEIKQLKKNYGEGGSFIEVLKGVDTSLEKGKIIYMMSTTGIRAFDSTSGMICARVVSIESTRSQIIFLYVPLDCESTEPSGILDSFTVSLRRIFARTSNVAAWESVVDIE